MARLEFAPVLLILDTTEIYFVNRDIAEEFLDFAEFMMNAALGQDDPTHDSWIKLEEDEGYTIEDVDMWDSAQDAADKLLGKKR